MTGAVQNALVNEWKNLVSSKSKVQYFSCVVLKQRTSINGTAKGKVKPEYIKTNRNEISTNQVTFVDCIEGSFYML